MRFARAIFLLILPLTAAAQENRGVSWILQMCSERSDCGGIMSAYRKASVLNAGWMELTSNPNRCKCAPTFLADPRPKRVRIDICNSTCFPERGRQCQPHECFAGMNAASASAAILAGKPEVFARIDRSIAMARADLLAAHPPLEVAVNACLECTLTHAARVKLAGYVSSRFPSYRMVDNPINDSCLPGYLCERHGTPNVDANGISDNDGADYDGIDQLDYWRQNSDAYMALAWKGCNNGMRQGDTFSPPQNRVNYCGSRDFEDFSSATADGAITPEPSNPADLAGCKVIKQGADGPKGFVLKLGEGRNYGVWLAPPWASRGVFKKVEIRHAGAVVDVSRPRPGFRYGVPYLPDPPNARRRIYDFSKPPHEYPKASVLFADGNCWQMDFPMFRVD